MVLEDDVPDDLRHRHGRRRTGDRAQRDRGHQLAGKHLILGRSRQGEVEIDLEYVPRPEYGLVVPLFDVADWGVAAFGGADVVILSSPAPLRVDRSAGQHG